jgi:hypothetical protein
MNEVLSLSRCAGVSSSDCTGLSHHHHVQPTYSHALARYCDVAAGVRAGGGRVDRVEAAKSRFYDFVQLCPLEEESDQLIGEIMKIKMHRTLLTVAALSATLLLTAGGQVLTYIRCCSSAARASLRKQSTPSESEASAVRKSIRAKSRLTETIRGYPNLSEVYYFFNLPGLPQCRTPPRRRSNSQKL